MKAGNFFYSSGKIFRRKSKTYRICTYALEAQPRAAAYALQDTANLGLFAPPPLSRPVRELTSVKHTPGPAAMLSKSPKFTYSLRRAYAAARGCASKV